MTKIFKVLFLCIIFVGSNTVISATNYAYDSVKNAKLDENENLASDEIALTRKYVSEKKYSIEDIDNEIQNNHIININGKDTYIDSNITNGQLSIVTSEELNMSTKEVASSTTVTERLKFYMFHNGYADKVGEVDYQATRKKNKNTGYCPCNYWYTFSNAKVAKVVYKEDGFSVMEDTPSYNNTSENGEKSSWKTKILWHCNYGNTINYYG